MVRTSGPRAYADLTDRAREAARGVTGVTDAWVRLEWRADGTADRSSLAGFTEVPDDPTAPLAVLDGGPLALPSDLPRTLCDALIRASRTGRGTTYIRADGTEDRQTYRELLVEAASMVAGLRGSGLRAGDSVLLHCDDNRNFVTAFWACLLGGFVPTPIAIAPTYRVENATTRRIRNTWELLDRPPLVTDQQMAHDVRRLTRLWDTSELTVLVVEELHGDGPADDLYAPDPEHPVVHLLTSGSTGVPKCVRHVHRTILTRSFVNGAVNGFGPADVTLNFMPLDHVGGMVMHNLRDVVLQCEHVNARMASFMTDPLRWLTWIERHRATNTFAPNFVITLITKLAEEIGRRRWDLSSMRDITNGGEAIVSRTTHEFLRILAPHGLRPDAMRPAWGMSETCGGVIHSTLHRDDESVGCVTIDQWGADGRVSFLPQSRPGHPTLTEVGAPVPGTSLRIVDAADRALSESRVGRLQIRGPSLMVEYFKNREANAAARTADGWFDTGDLGFVRKGRLVMTGRDKDVLVIRSANYPCHEIETVAESVEGVLPTFVAACSEHVPDSGTDELVLFCALASADPQQRQVTLREVTRRLTTEIGIRPRRVVPVHRDAFPKTSAGKIERQRLLADYQAGLFDDDAGASDTDSLWLYRPVWVPAQGTQGQLPTGCWLVFDDADLVRHLDGHLPSGVTVVRVRPGSSWIRRSDVDYSIDPMDQRHFDELLAAARRDHGVVGAVLHGWGVTADGVIGSWTDSLERSVLSVHRVLKASLPDVPRLLALTTWACSIDEADPVEPLHAAMNGLIRTASSEFGPALVRQLDLPSYDPDMAPLALAELADAGDDDIVAYRSGRRFVLRLRPLAEPSDSPAHRILPGGLYLMTGGLGRIGHRIGQVLLSGYGVRLLVNGRSAPSGERAARLADLEVLGDVTYVSADVTDESALVSAVTAAEDRLGRTLDGVIHLAGADITSYWEGLESHSLAMEHAEEFHRHYEAKVGGTLAVAAVLEDRPEALLIIASSVNGHFGGVAFGAYSSASSFLPAFVEHWRRRGRAAQCHSWSRWVDDAARAPGLGAMERHGFRPIDPGRAAELFEAALADTASNVLIGLDDSKPAVAREVDPTVVADFDLVVSFSEEGGVRAADVRAAVAASLERTATVVRAERIASAAPARVADHEFHDRERPLDEFEAAVAHFWQKALRQEKIGRDANFFDLGGDSLTGMMMIGQLNASFGSHLEVSDLYDKPTLTEIAQALSTPHERRSP